MVADVEAPILFGIIAPMSQGVAHSDVHEFISELCRVLRAENTSTEYDAMVKRASTRGLLVGVCESRVANQEIERGTRGLLCAVTNAVTRRCKETPAMPSKEAFMGRTEVALPLRPVQMDEEIPLVRAERAKFLERARFRSFARSRRRGLRASVGTVPTVVSTPTALAAASNRRTSLHVVARVPAVGARHAASLSPRINMPVSPTLRCTAGGRASKPDRQHQR